MSSLDRYLFFWSCALPAPSEADKFESTLQGRYGLQLFELIDLGR